jgi:hypothetical protein
MRPGERSPSGPAALPQDILFGTSLDPGGTRSSGILSRRVRNLVLAAAVPIVAVVVVVAIWPSAGDLSPSSRSVMRRVFPEPEVPTPGQSPTIQRPDLRSYAVSANELQGLPFDSPPGTRIELWVAWEPPITDKPRVHLLVSGVVLEKIAPPTIPDGPHTAVLLVPPKRIPDVIYGDLYGRLSAVVVPD